MTDALQWLRKRQKKSGCFRSMGKLFNNALQVGQGLWWGPRVWSGHWGVLCIGMAVVTARPDPCPTVPLQGGVSDELSLSAYVTAAMLELGLPTLVSMDPSSPQGLVVWGQRIGHSRPPHSLNWAQLVALGSPSESCAVGWLLTPLPHQEPTVSSALKCLQASPTENPYTQALLAYVFGLAGLREQQQAQLQHLAQHSISTGTAQAGAVGALAPL